MSSVPLVENKNGPVFFSSCGALYLQGTHSKDRDSVEIGRRAYAVHNKPGETDRVHAVGSIRSDVRYVQSALWQSEQYLCCRRLCLLYVHDRTDTLVVHTRAWVRTSREQAPRAKRPQAQGSNCGSSCRERHMAYDVGSASLS